MKKLISTLVGIFLNSKIADLLQNTLETIIFSSTPGGAKSVAKNVFLGLYFYNISCAFDFSFTAQNALQREWGNFPFAN